MLAAPGKRRRPLAALLAAASATLGCYSGDTLVQRVRDRAVSTRLTEIDLGTFRVTLPRDQANSEVTEIDVHLFGETPRYKLEAARQQLEENAYLLQDRTLATLRELRRRDLTHPDLPEVRQRMLATVNSVLDDPVVSSIGFYNVRFIYH